MTNLQQTRLDAALTMAAAAATALDAATDELCRLDSVAGDGDHGLAMQAAARAVLAALTDQPPTDLAALASLLSARFADVGGSMGALGSVAFDELGVAVTGSGDGDLDVAALLDAVTSAMSDFGGARPGDKTIVDAMAAAVDAARAANADGADTATVLARAADGAVAGADATAALAARIGRASRLGDRSIGSVDAGARSFAIVMSAIAGSYVRGGQA